MGVFYLQSRYPDSFTMSRLSFSLVVLCLGAVSAAPSGLDNWFFELTVPYIPEFTVDGVTVNLQGNITHMFTDPDFTYDLQTTAKTATLSAKTTMLSVGHYKTSGSVEGMDISGEGEIAFELSGGASETLSYTSKSADSFCVVPGSVKIAAKTNQASLTITGMKDKTVHDLITGFVSANQAKLGSMAAQAINSNYGADINKYAVPILNSICGDLPPPSA